MTPQANVDAQLDALLDDAISRGQLDALLDLDITDSDLEASHQRVARRVLESLGETQSTTLPIAAPGRLSASLLEGGTEGVGNDAPFELAEAKRGPSSRRSRVIVAALGAAAAVMLLVIGVAAWSNRAGTVNVATGTARSAPDPGPTANGTTVTTATAAAPPRSVVPGVEIGTALTVTRPAPVPSSTTILTVPPGGIGCYIFTGNLTFSPGVISTPTRQDVTGNGLFSDCRQDTGATPLTASVTLDGTFPAVATMSLAAPSGTQIGRLRGTITWSDSTTSQLTVDITADGTGQPTQARINAHVTSGRFAGPLVSTATLSIAPQGSSPITGEQLNVTPLTLGGTA